VTVSTVVSSASMSLMTVTSHLILKQSSLTYDDSSFVLSMKYALLCDTEVLLENMYMLFV
jgi:hypothetical protein